MSRDSEQQVADSFSGCVGKHLLEVLGWDAHMETIPAMMPIMFSATEIGFQDGLGGASNSHSSEEYHYVLFGVQKDEQHASNSGVYFEYDDQINGGVDQVQKVLIGSGYVSFVLNNEKTICVDCRECGAQWRLFLDGIHETFPNPLIEKA
jgi:hypothetical protein